MVLIEVQFYVTIVDIHRLSRVQLESAVIWVLMNLMNRKFEREVSA